MAETKKVTSDEAAAAQPLPGAVISPGAADSPAPAAEPQVTQTPPPIADPEPQPIQTAQPQPETPPEDANQFTPQGDFAPNEDHPEVNPISWTASEFIAHEKNASWYIGLIVASVFLGALSYLITKDKVTMTVVLVAGLVLAMYGARKPRQIEYQLDGQGITVGAKHFAYNSFRSFSVIPEGAFSSIVFIPLKRFGLPLTLYYAPNDEDKIVDILSDRLPLEERRPDVIENLMRRIRF